MKQDRPGVAIVTGSSKRIGLAIVQTLHGQGYDIAMCVNQAKVQAESEADKLNAARENSVSVFQHDLTKLDAIGGLVADIAAWNDNMQVLVNNASQFMADESADDWQALFALNAIAPLRLSQAIQPYLKKNNGSIIHIADAQAHLPDKGFLLYGMSKAALLAQVKVLARDYAPDVRVNAICPGGMLWPEDETAMSEAEKQLLLDKTWLGKLGGVRPMTQAVSYLIDNDYVTGTALSIDGGRLL